MSSNKRFDRPVRIGLGGPVGSGKTMLALRLCEALRDDYSLAVITNDIYTLEDEQFLVKNGALGQMPLDDTLGLAFYHGLTPFVNAALKLVRMGQLACQKILSEALGQTGGVVERAKRISIEEMGWLCPALDISSSRHETAFSRLFIS